MLQTLCGSAVRVRAYAKINLGLSIIGRRTDGMHCIRSVMQTVGLHDDLLFWFDAERKPRVICSHPQVPHGHSSGRNTVLQAGRAFGGAAGMRVYLRKRIPVGGGLGGGSSNAAAAAAVVSRRTFECLPHEVTDWRGKAAEVGADVPFFVHGGTQLAEGAGERLRRLPDLPAFWVLLFVPPVSCDTADVYRSWAEVNRVPTGGEMGTADAERPLRALTGGGDLRRLLPRLRNDLESAALYRYPSLVSWKEALQAAVERPVLMSGSGSTFFTLYRSLIAAQTARRRLLERVGSGSGARMILTRFRSGCGWQMVRGCTGEETKNEAVRT